MPARTSVEKGVCLSICPSITPSVKRVIVTERNKDLCRFLYQTKDYLAQFSEKKNGSWGRPLLPEILGQADTVGEKSPICSRYSLAAP